MKKEFLVVGMFAFSSGVALAEPKITKQPADRSVSLGADVLLQATASGTAPLRYAWRFNGNEILSETNSSLLLGNVQTANAGKYDLVVTDTSGSTISRVAVVEVDTQFTKITCGSIVTDRASFFNCLWADFDNDGFLDLFAGAAMGAGNHLYRNNQDGTFSRIFLPEPNARVLSADPLCGLFDKLPATKFPLSGNHQHGAAWGDLDNDGNIDLFVTGGQNEAGASGSFFNALYRNNGDGTFAIVTNTVFSKEQGQFHGVAWVDYDRDGYLDLFVTPHGASAGQPPAKNRLYRNNGNATFSRILTDPAVNDPGDYLAPAITADYDNDGWPDLFVPNEAGANRLYHNNGAAGFTAASSAVPAQDTGPSVFAAWGDIDNDGLQDLFASSSKLGSPGPLKNLLYHNDGNGKFSKISQGAVVEDSARAFVGCAWADYDNDGFLDLIVGMSPAIGADCLSYLYHNNGDGSFERVKVGSVSSDLGFLPVYAWGDYDNDGFLDLFVAYGQGWDIFRGPPYPTNALYRNNGNSNSWIDIKLVGTVSTRSAIGAKVRVKAFYRGQSRWQMREISNQQAPNAHFGFGGATSIETIQIEWPSGIVQTFSNVMPKQALVITEPARLKVEAAGKITVQSWPGQAFIVQASNDLQSWTDFDSITNSIVPLQFVSSAPMTERTQYFRVRSK